MALQKQQQNAPGRAQVQSALFMQLRPQAPRHSKLLTDVANGLFLSSANPPPPQNEAFYLFLSEASGIHEATRMGAYSAKLKL